MAWASGFRNLKVGPPNVRLKAWHKITGLCHPHAILLDVVKGTCLSLVVREIQQTKVCRELLRDDVSHEWRGCLFLHPPDLLGHGLNGDEAVDLVFKGVKHASHVYVCFSGTDLDD